MAVLASERPPTARNSHHPWVMSQPSDQSLSQDVVFDLLSSSRRRFVLQYLSQRERPVAFSELANELAAWENDTDVESITERQRKRVYVSLYQTHIPKLEEAGIVAYDQDSGEVQLRSRMRRLSAHLDTDERSFPWPLAFLALSAVSLLFFVAVLAGVPGFAAVSWPVAVLVIVAAFGVLAAAQYATTRRGSGGVSFEGMRR